MDKNNHMKLIKRAILGKPKLQKNSVSVNNKNFSIRKKEYF